MRPPRTGPEMRSIWSRFIRYWVEPAFWILDVTGEAGRPVHSKVCSTLVVFILLPGTAHMGYRIALNVTDVSPTVVAGWFASCLLLVSASFGPRMMELYLKSKVAETSIASLGDVGKAEAAIRQRRQVGADLGVEPTA